MKILFKIPKKTLIKNKEYFNQIYLMIYYNIKKIKYFFKKNFNK